MATVHPAYYRMHCYLQVDDEAKTVNNILTCENIPFPSHASPLWSDFVRQALQKRPHLRPTAESLMEHPCDLPAPSPPLLYITQSYICFGVVLPVSSLLLPSFSSRSEQQAPSGSLRTGATYMHVRHAGIQIRGCGRSPCKSKADRKGMPDCETSPRVCLC